MNLASPQPLTKYTILKTLNIIQSLHISLLKCAFSALCQSTCSLFLFKRETSQKTQIKRSNDRLKYAHIKPAPHFTILSLRFALVDFLSIMAKYIVRNIVEPIIMTQRHILPYLIILSVLFCFLVMIYVSYSGSIELKSFVHWMLCQTKRASSKTIQHCIRPKSTLSIDL